MTQPFALILSWGTLTGYVLKLHVLQPLLFCILAAIFVASFFPLLHFYAGQETNNLRRLLIVIWLFQCAILPLKFYNLSLNIAPVELSFVRTGLLGAIVYFLAIMYLLRQWKWGNPFAIASWRDGFNLLVIVILVVLTFLLTFSRIDPSVWVKTSNLQKLKYLLFALEAGIAEEMLCRAAIPASLGNLFSKSKNCLLWTIILSSILFGCFYLTNLTVQSLDVTIFQVVMAAFSGLLFILLYLYTGQLCLVIALHFYTDFASSVNDSSVTIQQITTNDWVSILIAGVIVNVLLIWLMFGKRRQVMDLHLKRLANLA